MRTLWTPTDKDIENANLSRYINWLNAKYSLGLNDYHDFWRWSVDELELFWESILEYLNIELEGDYEKVISSFSMPPTTK